MDRFDEKLRTEVYFLGYVNNEINENKLKQYFQYTTAVCHCVTSLDNALLMTAEPIDCETAQTKEEKPAYGSILVI